MNTLGATSPGLRATADAAGARSPGLDPLDESGALFGAVLGALKSPAAAERPPAADRERPAGRGADDEEGTLSDTRPEPANTLDLLAAVTPAHLPGAAPARMPVRDSLETLVARALPKPAPAEAAERAAVTSSAADSRLPELRAGMTEALTPVATPAPEARTRVTVLRRETHFAPVQPRLLTTAQSPVVERPSSAPVSPAEPDHSALLAADLTQSATPQPASSRLAETRPTGGDLPSNASVRPPTSSELMPDTSWPQIEEPQAAIVVRPGGSEAPVADASHPVEPSAVPAPMPPGAEPAAASSHRGSFDSAIPAGSVSAPEPHAPLSPVSIALNSQALPGAPFPAAIGVPSPRPQVDSPFPTEIPTWPESDSSLAPSPQGQDAVSVLVAPAPGAPAISETRAADPRMSLRPISDAASLPPDLERTAERPAPPLTTHATQNLDASALTVDAPASMRLDGPGTAMALRQEAELAPTDRPVPEVRGDLASDTSPKATVPPTRPDANASERLTTGTAAARAGQAAETVIAPPPEPAPERSPLPAPLADAENASGRLPSRADGGSAPAAFADERASPPLSAENDERIPERPDALTAPASRPVTMAPARAILAAPPTTEAPTPDLEPATETPRAALLVPARFGIPTASEHAPAAPPTLEASDRAVLVPAAAAPPARVALGTAGEPVPSAPSPIQAAMADTRPPPPVVPAASSDLPNPSDRAASMNAPLSASDQPGPSTTVAASRTTTERSVAAASTEPEVALAPGLIAPLRDVADPVRHGTVTQPLQGAVAAPSVAAPPSSAPQSAPDGLVRDAVPDSRAESVIAMVSPETHGSIIRPARAIRDGESMLPAEPASAGPAPVALTNQPIPGAPGAPSPLNLTGTAPIFSESPAQQVASAILGQTPRPPSGAVPNGPGLDGPLRLLTLQLHPADLGVVQVRMRLRDGHLEMSLQASREETATLLREGGGVLTDLLRQGGYQLERVTIVSGPLPHGSVPADGQGFPAQGNAGANPDQATRDQPDRRPSEGRSAPDTSSERTHESVSSSPDRSGVYL